MLASSATASPSPTIAAAARAIARFRSTSRRSRRSKPTSDWPCCERPDAAADARDEALPRELGEVAAHRHLGDREGFRKFRNLNGIARLEQAQHVLPSARDCERLPKIVQSASMRATLRLMLPQVKSFE